MRGHVSECVWPDVDWGGQTPGAPLCSASHRPWGIDITVNTTNIGSVDIVAIKLVPRYLRLGAAIVAMLRAGYGLGTCDKFELRRRCRPPIRRSG